MAKMTRILIPSDFTVDSLYFVRQSIESSSAEEVDVILVYGNKSSTSASELIGIGVEDQLDQLQSDAFLKACERICQRFKNRKLTIYADIIRTDNASYLHHYLRGAGVNEIKIPANYSYQNKTRNFFDVGKALRKLKNPVLHPISVM